MGTDVYSYIMIGVPAKNYLSYETKIVEVQERNNYSSERELLFRKDGSPVFRTVTKGWYAYKGKEYHNYYDIEELNPDKEEENAIVLVSSGEYEIGSYDTIGMKVCDEDKLETSIEELQRLIPIVKQKLVEMGITEDPTIRLNTFVSY